MRLNLGKMALSILQDIQRGRSVQKSLELSLLIGLWLVNNDIQLTQRGKEAPQSSMEAHKFRRTVSGKQKFPLRALQGPNQQ
jgi:hypothetical protein